MQGFQPSLTIPEVSYRSESEKMPEISKDYIQYFTEINGKNRINIYDFNNDLLDKNISFNLTKEIKDLRNKIMNEKS